MSILQRSINRQFVHGNRSTQSRIHVHLVFVPYFKGNEEAGYECEINSTERVIFRPLQEPIRFQDLVNSNRSRAKKKTEKGTDEFIFLRSVSLVCFTAITRCVN